MWPERVSNPGPLNYEPGALLTALHSLAIRLLLLYCCFTSTVNIKVMAGRSVNLTTLFLGRFRPPKRLTSTSCTYFRQ